jgi:hypothetical protein
VVNIALRNETTMALESVVSLDSDFASDADVRICGGHAALGDWNADLAPQLVWDPTRDRFVGCVRWNAGVHAQPQSDPPDAMPDVEFKLVAKRRASPPETSAAGATPVGATEPNVWEW